MVAFDKRIFVGTLWGTDLRFNAQTQQKAPQGRGKITATGTAHPARITIKGQHGRQAIRAQEGDHGFQSGFRMKIITGLSTEQNRGPGIDKIEHLDDMLLFALGISGDAGGIFEIHLDLLEWFTRRQWDVACARGDREYIRACAGFSRWCALSVEEQCPEPASQ